MGLVKRRVGQELDTYCSRCKLELGHLIVALVENSVKRVKCLTCQSEHAYHGSTESGKKSTPAKGATPRARQTATVKATDYERLMSGREQTKAQNYDARKTYEKNDIINHPTFGIGLVVAIKDIKKIEVAFPDGAKTLLHRIEA